MERRPVASWGWGRHSIGGAAAALTSLAAVIGLAGCASSMASPGAQASGVPSAYQTVTASPTTGAAPTVTPAPTPNLTSARTPTFVATGHMKYARADATATLLANGKVLVAGGSTGVGWTMLASAELYDPSTDKFTPTGSMNWFRVGHTATLLRDGRVLIAGGNGCPNPKKRPSDDACMLSVTAGALSSAELYDPTTGEFTPAGSMTTARTDGSATLLPDGRVLIVSASATDAETAELYDPQLGEFVRTGSAPSFWIVQATLLRNGKVLVTGAPGRGELFDPATGQFVVIPFGTAEYPHAALQLRDGRIVLLCDSGRVEVYDPDSHVTVQSGVLSANGDWSGATATLLTDGRVLFAGGTTYTSTADESANPINAAGIYDPVAGLQILSLIPASGKGQSATLLPDGRVLLVGGTTDGQTAISTSQLFVP